MSSAVAYLGIGIAEGPSASVSLDDGVIDEGLGETAPVSVGGC